MAAKQIQTMLFEKDAVADIVVGDVINTFRVGSKWFDLLDQGDLIRLASSGDENDAFGHALVTGVHGGQWADMKEFADSNLKWGHLQRYQAQEMLLVELGRVYENFDPLESYITVVELVLLPHDIKERM